MKTFVVKTIGRADVAQDIVRLHKLRREGISRHSVVLLKHISGQKKYVVALGHDGAEDEIRMDFDLREHFSLDVDTSTQFSVTDGGYRGKLAFLWKATAPSIYVPYRIALISLLLGIIGLGLGVLSIWK